MDFNEVKDIIVGSSSFSLVDYTVVGISLAFVLFCGFYHGILSPTNREDFLVGGRTMRSSPIAISTAMIYLSGLAVLESPTEIYYNGIQSFMASILVVVFVPVSAVLFVSMIHNLQLTSVHQYVGHRFDSTFFRRITSLVFIVHESIYACVMLGVMSYALENYFQIPMMTSIIGIGAFTTISTTMGGFRATVWTQVFYYFWVTMFLLAFTIVSGTKAGGFLKAFELAATNERLKLFQFQVNIFESHNFWNFAFGYGFVILLEMITRQSIVQRYSSIDRRRDVMKSICMSIPVYILPSLLCLLIAIFVQAVYAGCDPFTTRSIHRPEDIMPHFFKKTLSLIPGIIGFFTAVIVGSAICMYSVSINSVTACIYQDFISKASCCKSNSKKSSESDSSACCRFISFTYALASCALTFFVLKFAYMEEILPVVSRSNILTFNAVLYGPLAGIFLLGMFSPCTTKYGALVGFVGGVISTGYVTYFKIMASRNAPPSMLPPILGECPDLKGLDESKLFVFLPWHPQMENSTSQALELEMNMHVDDLFAVSYLLMSLFGAIITIIIGCLISVLTGGLCACTSRKVSANLLHPLLRGCGCCVDTEERHLQNAISHRYVDRIASVHNLHPGGSKLGSNPPSFKYSSLPTSPDYNSM